MDKELNNVLRGVLTFETLANQLFAQYETSLTRVITLNKSLQLLRGLSLNQESLLKEALSCIEHQAFRGAIVLSWAAFVDYVIEKLGEDGFAKVTAKYRHWQTPIDEYVRDNISDHSLVEVAASMGLLGKQQKKSVLGLLAKRNECAHPSGVVPDLNEALGFISDLLNRMSRLKQKRI